MTGALATAGERDPGGFRRHRTAGLDWWHAAEPTTAALVTIGRELDVPGPVLDAVGAGTSRPQRRRCDGWRMWVLAPVAFQAAAAQVVVGHLVVATDGTRVLTCGAVPGCTFEQLVARVLRRLAAHPTGAAQLVDALLAELLDVTGQVVDELDDAVQDVEDAVFASPRGSHAERIYRLKREIHRARRSVERLPELFAAPELTPAADGHAAGGLDAEAGVEATALHAHALRLVEQIAHDDALLDGVLAAHQAQVTIQQNDDMRRISAWVAIVAAPTAIASIYGMNFRHMPELASRWGYPAVLLGMLAVCLTLYRLLRRSGWL